MGRRAPPPPRRPGQTGRPRLKGARLPSLWQRLADPQTTWRPLIVRWTGVARVWTMPRARPSGSTPASPSCPCTGCCWGTRPGSAHRPPCWAFRLGHRGGPCPATGPAPGAAPGGLVSQDPAHLRRCPGPREAHPLDRKSPFFTVPTIPPTGENPRPWTRPNSGSSSATPSEYDRNRPCPLRSKLYKVQLRLAIPFDRPTATGSRPGSREARTAFGRDPRPGTLVLLHAWGHQDP